MTAPGDAPPADAEPAARATAPDVAQTAQPRLRKPVWWRRIHWRLMASYVLLAALVIGTLWIFLSAFLDRNLEQASLQRLEREARLAADVVSATDPSREPLTTLERLDQRLDARLLLLAADDTLLADTRPGRPLPERRDTLVWTQGEAMHALVPIPEHSSRLHVVAPQSAFGAPVRSLSATLLAGAIVAVVVAGILGFIASRFFTRPVIELGQVALAMARGDFSSRVDYPVADELGLLGDSLDHLSSELSEKLRLLTAEKTRLGTILRSMTEGVVVVGASGHILLVNPSLRQMFDLPPDVEGQPIDDVPAAADLAQALSSGLSRSDSHTDEIVVQKGNFKYDIRVSVAAIDTPGELPAVAVLSDISQVRRLERIRRDFVANVSHELRTPLTAVRGYTETLLDADLDLPEMARDFLDTILRHTVRLFRLIDDLLTLASIEGRGLDSRLQATDVEDAVHDAIDLLELQALEQSIEIDVELPGDLPSARAEERALRHVLSNLLENAVKYTTDGGHVRISAFADDHAVTIEVTDTGIGIDAVHLPRIFERFYRVDEGRSRDVGGSGLGLAIVKHLVSTLGGSITARSEGLGEGTTFSLRLQRA